MTGTRFGSRPARLHLEHLEDRSVPSTFIVNTTLDDVTPANGKLSLREAITKANTTPGADVIVLPAGVFRITQDGAGESANVTGDFDITDAVTIAGAGAGATIVDAQQKDRVFEVSGSGPVVIAGLTIRNGLVTGGPGDGGGIRAVLADLVVRDCAVVGNRASEFGGGISNDSLTGTGNVKLVRTTLARNVSGLNGGGIFLHNSVLTVTNSTIRLNVAGGSGGGTDATTATLTNSTVSGNTAGGSGGGISAEKATLTNCTVSGNSSPANGGGINVSNTATLTNCTVSGNFAAGNGGGIGVSNTATLTNCTMSGNASSQRGGGINATTATLTNNTITGNSAVIEGGGIFSTTASLLNCTVAENSAGTGGGLFHVAGGTFSVRNTIVALNLVGFGGNGPDAFGASFTSQGHNLIGDGTGSNGFTQGVGDIVGTSANPIDPKLGPLQNNGGLTKTMALLTGSLAIDHGDNSILPATDQRGLSRKKDGNFDGLAIVDIGAFER